MRTPPPPPPQTPRDTAPTESPWRRWAEAGSLTWSGNIFVLLEGSAIRGGRECENFFVKHQVKEWDSILEWKENRISFLCFSPHHDQKSPALLVPQVLSVLVVSFGTFIHGTSVVFGIYATMGLETESQTLKPNTNETVLGFEYDSVRDASWIRE